jgi:hypothetical protein
MRSIGVISNLCALVALGVAARPASAHPDAPHKDATLVYAGRTESYRVDLPTRGSSPLAFRVRSLPDFAKFDAKSGAFTFQPRANQVGRHRAELEISDGDSTFPYTLTVTVQPNHAPAVVEDEQFLVANRSARPMRTLVADEDQDPLTVVEQRLPAGARLVEAGNLISLDWKPTDADVGEHRFMLVASDGLETTRLEQTLIVVAEWHVTDWSTHLVPSVGTTAFVSHSGDTYAGGVFEWTLFARRAPARNGLRCRLESYDGDCHASLFRFYVNFELLDAPRAEVPALFSYAFGYAGSFETFTERRWLIPFYAVELGGLWEQNSGHRFGRRSAIGVHLWADHRVWLDLAVGERVVPTELSRLSGPSATLSAMLIPW